jgi:hypothetical protein
MSVLETPTRPHGHDTHPIIAVAEAQCPYCGQSISRREFKEIQAKIADQERARVAKVEGDLKARFARETAQIEAKAKKDAAKAAAAQIKALKESTAMEIATHLEAQRETYEKATAGAVLAERATYLGEKLKMEEQLQDMQRRLQAKTAHQLGEPAEVDLYEALATAFPEDRVSRVVKGVKGPDVIVEVVHQGEIAGKVVIDSKNHSRWSNKFTQKLSADARVEKADFSILSSSVFPAGAEQVHLQDNVIVASPQRVVVLLHLLRRQIVQSHVHKLSAADRNAKADKLYAFVISPACTDLLDRIVTLTTDMAELDVKEASVHATTWKKRGDLIRAVQGIHDEFSSAVSVIIAGEAP